MLNTTTERGRSSDACPVCGRHELALIDFPEVTATGYMPANEILGMGEPTEPSPPAIGCLACGSEWPSVEAFREALTAAPGSAAPETAPEVDEDFDLSVADDGDDADADEAAGEPAAGDAGVEGAEGNRA
jgi:hypothetical protein